jgi:membrane-bound serine protease (ClpP class)
MNITPSSGLVFEPLMVLAQTGVTGGSESGDPFWLSVGFGLGVLALILFAVEIFIPTAGMVGILCGISAVGSIIAFFQYSGSAGGLAILAYLIATPFLLVYGVKLWSQSPIGRRLILGGTDAVDAEGRDEEGVEAELAADRREAVAREESMIGRVATTLTPLRPIGVIRIDDHRRDALAESGVIEEGVEVEIVEIVDDQIKVRPRR